MENDKLKIGVDIDEVVCSFVKPFLNFCEEKLQRKIPYESVSDFLFEDSLKISPKEILFLMEEFPKTKYFNEMQIVEGAVESLKKLAEENEIYFITARPDDIKEQTKIFLRSHFSSFPFSIYFAGDSFGGKKNKFEICKELGVSILIEDRRRTALECATNGIKVFLMDKPWNQSCEHQDIIRVTKWREILENLLNEN